MDERLQRSSGEGEKPNDGDEIKQHKRRNNAPLRTTDEGGAGSTINPRRIVVGGKKYNRT